MVSSPLNPSLAQPATLLPVGATATLLKDTICRLPAMVMKPPAVLLEPEVVVALEQLIELVMALRSPTGGWPADLEQTPENLMPYVSEETGELLEALEQSAVLQPPLSETCADTLMVIPALIPHLLWMLASSGYEVMRLVEGVRARIYHSETEFALRVLRLVPVLSLTAEGQDTLQLDLVTQNEPVPHHYLTDATIVQMIDNDLDDHPSACLPLCDQLTQLICQTRPILSELLSTGIEVDALCPFQPWRRGTLKLALHLADMGPRQTATNGARLASETALSPDSAEADAGAELRFTLDDFADTLANHALPLTTGIFGDWLTFTDEAWVQGFLFSNAQHLITQRLLQLAQAQALAEADPELACIRLVYEATGLVQGPSHLGKHTFVHEPLLVADLWPRLQWYLAQSSKPVMQLMGGLSVRLMVPGRGWQTGTLYLRPLMLLTTDEHTWIIDLSTGRLLPTYPLALVETAVIDPTDTCAWLSPITVEDLVALITQDFNQHAPAIAALKAGTSIHLHQLEAAAGRQPGRLSIDWVFTLQQGI